MWVSPEQFLITLEHISKEKAKIEILKGTFQSLWFFLFFIIYILKKINIFLVIMTAIYIGDPLTLVVSNTFKIMLKYLC
jgi:hypothetical protein